VPLTPIFRGGADRNKMSGRNHLLRGRRWTHYGPIAYFQVGLRTVELPQAPKCSKQTIAPHTLATASPKRPSIIAATVGCRETAALYFVKSFLRWQAPSSVQCALRAHHGRCLTETALPFSSGLSFATSRSLPSLKCIDRLAILVGKWQFVCIIELASSVPKHPDSLRRMEAVTRAFKNAVASIP
jgi:hypothetical protein